MSKNAILLVEDNPDDEELTVRALRKNKIANDIVVARDGAEAIDFLFASGAYADRNPEDLPQVVLLDLNLPRLNGLDVLQRIRANPTTRRLPVVMLTSSKEQVDMAMAYDLGVNSYVQKPVSFDEFMEAARCLGLYWLVVNAPPPVS